jgi:hypothetical protein
MDVFKRETQDTHIISLKIVLTMQANQLIEGSEARTLHK